MPDFKFESSCRALGFARVAGVDEAGRGPLAGPVVVAAVVLPERWPKAWPLDDSKKLKESAREALYAIIRQRALGWKIKVVPAEVVDRLNILQATLLGMSEAVRALEPQPDYVLVDGNRLPVLDCAAEAVVKGDGRCNSIAAASILAKVVRDRLMRVYGARYPEWGFAAHKGYGTAAHLEALRRYGPSPIHRASFRVKDGQWRSKAARAGMPQRSQSGSGSDKQAKMPPPGIWN